MKPLSFLFSFTIFSLSAQNYWQQEVNYKIDVELNDTSNTLIGAEVFEYVNNSPDTLSFLYIHLWPNAYKNGETALAKQQYQNGKQVLKYGADSIRGSISGLNFKINGAKAPWEFQQNNVDIAIVTLNNPLIPGESIKVSTPFIVELPSGKVSRLGHIGQSYQITQWYPKPAVYDAEGWHAMPYLNQGEFYSEYGSFDVKITLPENYIVGATGDLITESEITFLNERASWTENNIKQGTNYKLPQPSGKSEFPISSNKKKTIQYVQDNVHDFAWFADKRFNVLKSEVKLPHSGRTVTSWAMYTNAEADLWINANEYLNDAIYYYSLWNGDYPYNNVTAVDGTISAGAGMEYPNVTVIGRSGDSLQLEIVIVHEVGHNWFYGQLGSNERAHGWMDEGMNTLNEVRYIETKYPGNTALSDMIGNKVFHADHLDYHDMGDFSYRIIAGLGEDQPIETHSARFSPINYGIIMYQKTGLVFYYLKDYLGDEIFDQCMRNYYSEWEFKHPQPQDMQRSMQRTSGKDLSWLFDDLIQTTNHVDFKLKRVKEKDNTLSIKVKNTGQVNGPIEINGLAGEKVVETVWVEPGQKTATIVLNNKSIDQVLIDHNKDIPEMNRQNNSWIKNKAFHRLEPLKLEFLGGDNEPKSSNMFWMPIVGANAYDKLMVGAALHNYSVPFNRFSYVVAPMFSFGRKMVSGIAEVSYTTQPKRVFKLSRFGISAKSFKHDNTFQRNESFYLTAAPYWTAKIGNRKGNGKNTQTIHIQTMYRKDKYGTNETDRTSACIEYKFKYNRADHKLALILRNDFILNVSNDDKMARITFASKYKFRYLKNKMKRWIEVRGFIGQQYLRDYDFNTNGYQYSMALNGTDGTQDLFVDEYFFGRSDATGIWSQQRLENMGGFKSTVRSYGTSAFSMATANLYIDLPLNPDIIGAFLDVGTFHNGMNWSTAYNAGLGIRFGEVFGLYFPIPGLMSKEIEDTFKNSSGNIQYGQMIRFTLKFNLLNKPLNIAGLVG